MQMDSSSEGYSPDLEQQSRVREKIISKHVNEEIGWATCAQNGCFSTCLLRVHKKNGRIIAIDTDNSIHKDRKSPRYRRSFRLQDQRRVLGGLRRYDDRTCARAV
jgi:hypothetical protein